MYRLKSFIKGIKNLIKYFNVIWNDRDYDYEYIEDILMVKLNGVKKDLEIQEKYGWSVSKQLKSVNLCIAILKRRKDDFYYTLYTLDELCYSNNYNMIFYLEKRDWGIFCNIWNKYFNTWWT